MRKPSKFCVSQPGGSGHIIQVSRFPSMYKLGELQLQNQIQTTKPNQSSESLGNSNKF